MEILVINGPNLNMLGHRDKGYYGTKTYEALCTELENKAEEEDFSLTNFQSNSEGAIVDRIQEAFFNGTDGVVINAGGYTHYSIAIRDALEILKCVKVEVHISDINARDEFRRISYIKDVCDCSIVGHGTDGYFEAIDFIIDKIRNRKE